MKWSLLSFQTKLEQLTALPGAIITPTYKTVKTYQADTSTKIAQAKY